MVVASIIVQSIGFGIVTAAIVAIGAMGFTLQFGVTNILNISYGNILTIGAFASLIVENNHLGLGATIIVAPIAGALVTFVLARTLFALFAHRQAGTFELIMVTLASSLIIEYSIDASAQGQTFAFTFPTGKTLHTGPFLFTTESLALIGVAIFVYAALMAGLHLTRMGKALRALSIDPKLARACGVPMRRMLNLTWLISGALAGLTGLIYVTNSLTVSANAGLDFLVLVIAAALLGGAGSPTGAVIASLVVGIATEVVAAVGGSYYSQAVGLGILAVVLIARPSSRAIATNRDEVTV
ncbi:MAG TPA: branched-chain amino acid ABC transporter permease [Solirubrobacteraceae bacterium]|jgi:branched-chain amino acid transport system permease protein/neutral amino acid transport system permease protein